MKLLPTAAFVACLTAVTVTAQAEMVELDDTQLDHVSAGFFDNLRDLFGTIGPLLPGGIEIELPELDFPTSPGNGAPAQPGNGFPGLPFDLLPGLPSTQ